MSSPFPTLASIGSKILAKIFQLIMSRHKMVKALDLNEELDVYDGLESDDFNDDLSPEDKGTAFGFWQYDGISNDMCYLEQLRQGTDEVRRTLGPDFPVTSDEIEDSLYYYYYDVPKTVNYLLSRIAL